MNPGRTAIKTQRKKPEKSLSPNSPGVSDGLAWGLRKETLAKNRLASEPIHFSLPGGLAVMSYFSRFFRASALACGVAVAAFTAVEGRAQSLVNLYEISRFDLSSTANSANPQFIGSNPAAVAWNGSKLYVAGANNSGGTANSSIIEITNPTATGIVGSPTFSAPFGTLSTANARGFTGLAINGSNLAVSWDNGANSPDSFRMADTGTNSIVWTLADSGSSTANVGTTRGFAGPAFDPGHNADPAQGAGMAWVFQGGGRRFLNNTATGAAIYTNVNNDPAGTTQGMIINNAAAASTAWRDIAFDPSTGNMFMRLNNLVTRTNRTGANANISPTGTTGASSTLVSLGTSNAVATNIGFLDAVASSTLNPYSGDLLVFNNRASTAPGQSFTSVIQFTDPDGLAITPSWTFLGGSIPDGNAGYDFGWDATSQTLAVMDYQNRSVSVFSTAVPEPTTWALLGTVGISAGVAALRRNWKPRV